MGDAATIGEDTHFGSLEQANIRAHMYTEFFRNNIYGEDAASFIAEFCKQGFESLKAHSHRLETKHKGNSEALSAMAGKVKYAIAHLKLAKCYGEQIGIMTEHKPFRDTVLTYVATAHAEIEAVKDFSHN